MPIKLNWAKGVNLGLSLIYLSIMGFFQIIFIIIAQYGLKVGSQYTVIFMSFGAILATFYSIIILFESQTSMKEYRSKRQNRGYGKKKKKSKGVLGKVKKFLSKPTVRPVIIVCILFTIFFSIGLGLGSIFIDNNSSLFITAENCGSIGCLIASTYKETNIKRNTRR